MSVFLRGEILGIALGTYFELGLYDIATGKEKKVMTYHINQDSINAQIVNTWYPETKFVLTDTIAKKYFWENTDLKLEALTDDGRIAIFNSPFVSMRVYNGKEIPHTAWIYYIASLDNNFQISSVAPVHPEEIISPNYWDDIGSQPFNYPSFQFPHVMLDSNIYTYSILNKNDQFEFCSITWQDSSWVSSSILNTPFLMNDYPIGYGVHNKDLALINFGEKSILTTSGTKTVIKGLAAEENIVHSGIIHRSTVIITRNEGNQFHAIFLDKKGVAVSESKVLDVGEGPYFYFSQDALIALYQSENKNWVYKIYK